MSSFDPSRSDVGEIEMAWGENGREMDSASPRYASQSGRTNRNDGMDGFDRLMKIFFLVSLPILGVVLYFGWENGWL
jgi:hypothetical protein